MYIHSMNIFEHLLCAILCSVNGAKICARMMLTRESRQLVNISKLCQKVIRAKQSKEVREC